MAERAKRGKNAANATYACALSIAGLDPGGGAGILADMRAFARAGAFGCAAMAVLTVQSTSGLKAARAIEARELLAQVREVIAHQRVRAIKTGALGSAANVRAIARWARAHAELPLVVDPVMIATRATRSGARLLDASALRALTRELVPRAWLVTANAREASVLPGLRVTNAREAEGAARALVAMGARAALVKGGHLDDDDAIDLFFSSDRARALELRAPRLPKLAVHGAGCTLASLIAGRLAHANVVERATTEASRSRALVDAVRWSKRVHHEALARSLDVGGALTVLSP